MNRARLRKLITVAAGLSLVALSAFAPVASAAPPNWTMDVERLPPTVKAGSLAGFRVTITNRGPSNISSLSLTGHEVLTPEYISDSRCDPTGILYCPLGSLSGGASVVVTVAYATPSSGFDSFSVRFSANTNGATTSDKGGNSRGDTLELPEPSTVELSTSPDFAGGFVIGGTSISNSTSLTAANPQSTRVDAPSRVDAPPEYFPATVQDGMIEDLCGPACPHRQFGQVSEVAVANGAAFLSPFKIVMTFRGQSLPSPKPNAATLVVYHELDPDPLSGIKPIEIISERCDDAAKPTNVPAEGCLVASYAGNTLQIVIWTYYNGKFRGAV